MKELIDKIKKFNALEIIISIEVVLFLLTQILYALKLFSLTSVALPYTFDTWLTKPWTIITYGFFHQSFIDLFFNMLLLFYFGSIFLDFDKPKKFYQIFTSGIISGGLFFLLSYRWLPSSYVNITPLLGVSAGLMAIMTYISMKMPQYQINIRFIGYVKLIHILIFFVAFNLLQLPLGNPGGYFAHLGGLAIGFIFFVIEKNLNKPKSIFDKNYKSKKDKYLPKNTKINFLLDKIRQSGYESLSEEEKEYLFRQSDKN
jgi:membrane associated rhomboid family serine protease